jgi:hypothetical protein
MKIPAHSFLRWPAAKRQLHWSIWVLLLFAATATAQVQEPTPPVNPWIERAQQLTDDLLSDTKALDTYDRAALWGRLAEVWWNEDPKQARTWFLNGIRLVESSPTGDKADQTCRLVATRILLSISAARDPDFSNRLTTILTKHVDRNNEGQTRENADAVVEAALSMLATNPREAARIGGESLNLGISFRLANLLWRLRGRDKAAGNELFDHVLRVAKSTQDVNLFSMLLTAAFGGPYKTVEHQAAVLRVLAETLYYSSNPQTGPPTDCQLASLATSYVRFFDQMSPLRSQRIRSVIAACASTSSAITTKLAKEEEGPSTVEELLKSAERAQSDEQKDNMLLAAADTAGSDQNFDESIRILDSISLDGKKRLGDLWDNRRWDRAASAVCINLKNDDLPAAMRTIDNSPNSLKAFVRLSVVAHCLPANGSINPIELLGQARNELDNAPVEKTVSWRLSAVRLYAQHSSSAAPAVLTEAVTAINRASDQKPVDCGSSEPGGNVFSNPLYVVSYKIPASLMERDDAGVRYALGSVKPADKRAVLRLQLLKDVLVQKAAYKVNK